MMKFLFGLLYLVFAIVILVQTARTEKKFLYLNEHFVIFSTLPAFQRIQLEIRVPCSF